MPFDVVLAADFSSPQTAVRAEVQILFSLASWLEHAGTQTRKSCPLHLACVGDAAPDSVTALARRAGARVTLHEPFLVGLPGGKRAFHRLRALDAGPFATGRVLLLDAGCLVLGDPQPALERLPGDALASSPADKAQVPAACWPALYRAAGLPAPTERMRGLRAELELPPRDGAPTFEGQAAQSAAMFPFYDPGTLLVPARAAAALREIWPDHFARLGACLLRDESLPLPAEMRPKLAGNVKVSLATAHAALLTSGRVAGGWRRLPRGADARMTHFQGGALRLSDARLLHAGAFFRNLTDPSQLPAQLQAAGGLWRSFLTEGRQRTTAGRAEAWTADTLPARWRRWTAAREGRRAEALLWHLHVRHVRPALRAAGEWA